MRSSDDEFEDFFRREYQPLVAHLRYMGLDKHAAMDSAQFAMAESLKYWGDLLDERAWVRKVARRHAWRTLKRDIERIRKEQEANKRSQQEHTDLQPHVQAELHEQARDVNAVLRSLPPAQRMVVAWLVDGYTPKEIARLTGQSDATVRSNLRHARRRLGTDLDGNG